MKTTAIFASANQNGSTALLLNTFLDALSHRADDSVTIFEPYKMTPQPCMGCGACSEADICIHDDLDRLWSAVAESSLLVIASPVYFRGLPSPLKAVIDRTQRHYMAKLRGDSPLCASEREAVVLLAAGTNMEDGETAARELHHALTALGVVRTRVIVAGGTNYGPVPQEKLEEIRTAAAELRCRLL